LLLFFRNLLSAGAGGDAPDILSADIFYYQIVDRLSLGRNVIPPAFA